MCLCQNVELKNYLCDYCYPGFGINTFDNIKRWHKEEAERQGNFKEITETITHPGWNAEKDTSRRITRFTHDNGFFIEINNKGTVKIKNSRFCDDPLILTYRTPEEIKEILETYAHATPVPTGHHPRG